MMNEEKKEATEQPREFNQALVNQLASEFLLEQRRTRRWGVFFKVLLALYLFAFLLIYLVGRAEMGVGGLSGGAHTALVDINGVIAAGSQANADYIVTGLRAAFEDENTAGVIVRINSPGGSAVQSGYVNDEIYRLREKYPDIPLYAVIGDVCASGGYYIAAAADEIYANKASIVGSIGVIASGFGFVDAIEKLGIERRVRHAGKYKDFLDPFKPLREEEVQHIDMLLDDIYQQFIAVVQKGRGDKLTDKEELFSGLVWTGEESLALGLIDELGSASYVAREVIGEEDIVNFTYRENYFDQFVNQLGAAIGREFYSLLKFKINQ